MHLLTRLSGSTTIPDGVNEIKRFQFGTNDQKDRRGYPHPGRGNLQTGSSMISNTTLQNRFVDHLKDRLASERRSETDYFAITHTDSLLVENLRKLLNPSNVLDISIPQPEWQMDAPRVDELLKFVIQTGAVSKAILLVGSTRGVTTKRVINERMRFEKKKATKQWGYLS